MIWWLEAHRAGPLAGVTAGLGLVAWLAASGRVLGGSIASPVAAGSAIPLVLVLPLGIVAALCWACSTDDAIGARAVAVRPNGFLLASYAAVAVFLAVVALVPSALSAPALTAAIARNVVGLVGFALIVRARVGAAGASGLTAAYLAVAAALGAGPAGGAAWWAWPVAHHVGGCDGATAAVLLVVGLARTGHPDVSV